MPHEHLALISIFVVIIAFLYSSVGHAGASGYIAVMSLFSLAPAFIKPTALVLNIFVAAIGAWQFYRAGHFNWTIFWPFAIFSIPLAVIGGYINPPARVFKILVGIILLLSALRFLLRPGKDPDPHPPSRPVAVMVGGGLGLLAGLTGTGGGIFLTPLLIFMHWARTKTASAVSAVFIIVNSLGGLFGYIFRTGKFPAFSLVFLFAAVVGGFGGSYLGSKHLPPVAIKRFLAAVLTIAGLKLIFT